MTDNISDEMIMALADGELSGEAADRVRSAIDADPRMQQTFEMYRQSRELLTGGFEGIFEKPVPEALSRLVLGPDNEPAQVVSLSTRRQGRPVRSVDAFIPQAAAAAVLIACAAFAGFQVGQGEGADGAVFLAGTLPDSSPLPALLSTLPAGEIARADGATFEVVATVRTGAGEVCREFELRSADASTLALACRVDGDWQIEVAALGAPAKASVQYMPASEGASGLIGVALDDKGAYDVLDGREEACALETGPCGGAADPVRQDR